MAKRKIFRRRRNGDGSVVKRKDGRFQASRMFHGKRFYFYSWDEAECYRWLDELKVKEMQGMPITNMFRLKTISLFVIHKILFYLVILTI